LNQVARVQMILQALDYYDGTIDGVLSRQTRAAIMLYEFDNDLPPTGEITEPLLVSLGISNSKIEE
jgi:peptidoglycan hydrolase-like protein with peptidoglycan-binding domain